VRGLVESGQLPDELAGQVIDAIRTGRFLVITDPELSGSAVAGRAALLEGNDPQLPPLG
jgi:hypothetical protein